MCTITTRLNDKWSIHIRFNLNDRRGSLRQCLALCLDLEKKNQLKLRAYTRLRWRRRTCRACLVRAFVSFARARKTAKVSPPPSELSLINHCLRQYYINRITHVFQLSITNVWSVTVALSSTHYSHQKQSKWHTW